ncbi:MAG: hypothetical protein MR646_03105 [Agathobacter sp.]|nr:hypothetical protein [Agathobacter sp.]
MPEKNKQEEFKVNKSTKELLDPKKQDEITGILNTPEGKKLVQELQTLQKELKQKGLKLEDQLIVGNKTLKDTIKNWDKKGMSDKAVVQYAALYIGACNHKNIPATYVGLGKTRKFNQPDVLGGKTEETKKKPDGLDNPTAASNGKQGEKEKQGEEDSIWDWIWDTVCALFGITTAHAKKVQLREHIMLVDNVRCANVSPLFFKENEDSYRKAKETVDMLRQEEAKWQKLFFGTETPPEITEKMKGQINQYIHKQDEMFSKGVNLQEKNQIQMPPRSILVELREMSPLDVCMKMAASQIKFSVDMTPESLSKDPEKMKILQQIGKDYINIIKAEDVQRLGSEVDKEQKPMDFQNLTDAMQKSADTTGVHPYVVGEQRADGKTNNYYNEKYNPLNDETVKEKIIKAGPILKAIIYRNADVDTLEYGAMYAKERLQALEHTVGAYEALKKKDYDGGIRLTSVAADHMAHSVVINGCMAFGERDFVANPDSSSEMKYKPKKYPLMPQLDSAHSLFENYSKHSFEKEKKRFPTLESPLAATMLMIKCGLEGNVAKYTLAIDPKTHKGKACFAGDCLTSFERRRLSPEVLNKATRELIERADSTAMDTEKNKQSEDLNKEEMTAGLS